MTSLTEVEMDPTLSIALNIDSVFFMLVMSNTDQNQVLALHWLIHHGAAQ